MIDGENTEKKLCRILAASAVCLSLLPLAVFSQESDQGAASEQGRDMTREERRAAWESLSEEEKQAKRQELRAKREQRRAEWEAMTPEEREAKREVRRAEMRAKWEAMTPEQREAAKKMRKQRRHRGGKRGDHGSEQDQSE